VDETELVVEHEEGIIVVVCWIVFDRVRRFEEVEIVVGEGEIRMA
jgi:hypothetical protein